MIRSSYAWITLVKGMCGVGVFALPSAFQQAGLWMAAVLTIALGYATAECMIKLVRCSQYLCKLKTNETNMSITSSSWTGSSAKERLSTAMTSDNSPETKVLSEEPEEESTENRITLNYGNMAEEAFASRGKYFEKFKVAARVSVNLCIAGLQIGICSVFYIFVIDHVKEVSDYLFSTDLNRNNLFFTVFPFFILLTSIRSMLLMSWIAFIGNVLVMSSIAVILVQLTLMPHIPIADLSVVTTIESTALSAGSITYAFTAPALVLPIENKMRSPQNMHGCCGVVSTAVTFVGLVYMATGILGYITYGENVLGSITLNLSNSPIDLSVKVMLMVMTYCGYLIQHYPVVEMAWTSAEPYVNGMSPYVKCALNYALRYTVVVLSFAFAYCIPNFKEVIPFIGVTTNMMLAFVFPALLESIVFFDEWQKENIVKFIYSLTLNVIYIILGLFFLFVGTYSHWKSMSS